MSNSYGEPDWATPGATSEPVTTTTQDVLSGGAITAPSATAEKDNSMCLIRILSLLNMALAGLMAACGVLAILDFNPSNTKDYAQVFLSVYMIIFALLLLIYELMWWKAIPFLNRILRKNFGFLYSIKGKGLYVVFIAFLTIGLRNDNKYRELTMATGIAFLVVGCLHVFLNCVKPELSDAYIAPTAGLTSSRNVNSNGSSPV